MAVDEAIAQSCRAGTGGPTLRFYAWDRPSISLGYFQRAEDVVDLDRCRDAGVPVVTRTTGGGAVYHDQEVTYSLAAPSPHPHFPPTISGTFASVARALAAGLAELGVTVDVRTADRVGPTAARRAPLCFDSTSRHEITLDGRKLIGSAQRRWKTAFLQHGSIRLADRLSVAARWFRTPNEEHPSSAHRTDPGGTERIAGLNTDGRSFTPHEVHRALIIGWERTFSIRLVPGALTEAERRAVAESPSRRDRAVTLVR
jgi:lipoate-protein ligase A